MPWVVYVPLISLDAAQGLILQGQRQPVAPGQGTDLQTQGRQLILQLAPRGLDERTAIREVEGEHFQNPRLSPVRAAGPGHPMGC
jgi:hypothetical protein